MPLESESAVHDASFGKGAGVGATASRFTGGARAEPSVEAEVGAPGNTEGGHCGFGGGA